MNVAKNLKLLSLWFGICLALHSANAETTNVFGDWIVLSTKMPATKNGVPTGLNPLWDPPTNMVADAIQRLPEYLQKTRTNGSARYTKELPSIQTHLPTTGCQFVGVTIEGRKAILLNCFPLSDSFSDGWKSRFVKVYDGGPRWWSVTYMPNEKQFTRLRVDLGF